MICLAGCGISAKLLVTVFEKAHMHIYALLQAVTFCHTIETWAGTWHVIIITTLLQPWFFYFFLNNKKMGGGGGGEGGLIYTHITSGCDRVPGEIKRSRDLRGGRWSWTLNYAQKRSWVGRWCWAERVGHLLLRVVQVVRRRLCNGHCLSDSVQHSSWESNCAVRKSLGNGEGTPP